MEILSDLWRDAMRGDFLAGTLLLIVAGVAILSIWFLYDWTDTVGCPTTPAEGIVTRLTHHPMLVQTTMAGKTPITTVIPESWSADVKTQWAHESVSIGQKDYLALEDGSRVVVGTCVGRWSGKERVVALMSRGR